MSEREEYRGQRKQRRVMPVTVSVELTCGHDTRPSDTIALWLAIHLGCTSTVSSSRIIQSASAWKGCQGCRRQSGLVFQECCAPLIGGRVTSRNNVTRRQSRRHRLRHVSELSGMLLVRLCDGLCTGYLSESISVALHADLSYVTEPPNTDQHNEHVECEVVPPGCVVALQ